MGSEPVLVGRRREDGPAEAGDGHAGRAPLAAVDGRLPHPAPGPEVLARCPPAGEAERRVGTAAAGQPRPDREGDPLAAAGADEGHVPPRQPPAVPGGELEDPDPGRAAGGAGGAEGRRDRVRRLVLRPEREVRGRHPAGADREPAPRGAAGDLRPGQGRAAGAAAPVGRLPGARVLIRTGVRDRLLSAFADKNAAVPRDFSGCARSPPS
jgi:hypothetical protein